MRAVQELAEGIGTVAACRALGVSRATFYRRKTPRQGLKARRYSRPVRALSPEERAEVMELVHSSRFVDLAPREIVAMLEDEGRYLCSVRTMYRLLQEHGEVRERRHIARRPVYQKPELIATGPNQVWSWDITLLKGPVRSARYHLYVVLDIYSRLVVGWTVDTRESELVAADLLDRCCAEQEILPGQLTIHADGGPSMTSKSVSELLREMGVTESHSRPYVKNDNPFSEAQFKTLKYRPDFPERFASLAHAEQHCAAFFGWYNHEHRHSGILMLTPASLHYGHAEAILEQRYQTRLKAYEEHPERFARPPRRLSPPAAVWINPPEVRPGAN